jgi:hypothetical protein
MVFSQATFQYGEELSFNLYYNSAMTGNITAGSMTSKVEFDINPSTNQKRYHIILDGETKGAFRWFYKAHDVYESYVNIESLLPEYYSERKQEGSYTANMDVVFDQENGAIQTINNKNNDIRNYTTNFEVQDLLSTLYYIRTWEFSNIDINQEFRINLFMDDSVYNIQFVFTGYETIETKLGKIRTMKFVPHVVTGGVFGEETPMTIYVSDDKNHLPILAEGKLMIGKARIELVEHKGVLHPIALE